MDNEARNPVLRDHVAVKRKLIPPFVHKLGTKLTQYSWTRQLVPEALWIGLVVEHCGYEAARGHCRNFSRAVCAWTDAKPRPMFVKFSSFASLSEDEKVGVVGALNAATLTALRESLVALTDIAPHHPLAFLGPAGVVAKKQSRLPEVLREFYDRNGRVAVLSMALGYDLALDQGKVHIAPHLVDGFQKAFRAIERYPETEEANRAAGMFRAGASSLFMGMKLDGGGFEDEAPWVEQFWNHVAGFGPCLHADTLEDEAAESDDPLEAFVLTFRNAVRADLRDRLTKWPLNLNELEAFEVVTALLCRQATLVMDMASSPGVWTPHLAPVLLRAIADVFISLAWILKDPGPRARRFVEDGLGAIKLQVAHQKRALETAADPYEAEQLRQMVDLWSTWLTSQRMEALVEVNLGSWSGLNTRKMADEAGFIDFYNHVYQPFSGVAHSNWAHVSMFNTIYCQNPAHSFHRCAAISPADADLYWVYLASKYFSKTVSHFDDTMGVNLPHRSFEIVARYFSREDDGG